MSALALIAPGGAAGVLEPADDAVDLIESTSGGCHGKSVTHPGTNSPETIEGGSGDDVIHGHGGKDILKGHGGNDDICAGYGDDQVLGGTSIDHITGGKDDDEIEGGSGSDILVGGSGHDYIWDGHGIDEVNAADGQFDILLACADGNDDQAAWQADPSDYVFTSADNCNGPG